jgi:hypothetical protein
LKLLKELSPEEKYALDLEFYDVLTVGGVKDNKGFKVKPLNPKMFDRAKILEQKVKIQLDRQKRKRYKATIGQSDRCNDLKDGTNTLNSDSADSFTDKEINQ